MKSRLRSALILSALASLTLSACDQTSFLAEAGSEIDEGNFGRPTMINTMAMTEGDATMVVGQRFQAEAPTVVTFEFNKSDLTPQAMSALDQQASWILQFPEIRFSVYGHADKVGSNAYNYNLGLRRAQTVVAYLVSRGVNGARLQALVSYGETRPVINTSSPEERNRRAVTEVSGFANGAAAKLNGKYAAVIFREYVEGATRPHPSNTVVETQTDPGGE